MCGRMETYEKRKQRNEGEGRGSAVRWTGRDEGPGLGRRGTPTKRREQAHPYLVSMAWEGATEGAGFYNEADRFIHCDNELVELFR